MLDAISRHTRPSMSALKWVAFVALIAVLAAMHALDASIAAAMVAVTLAAVAVASGLWLVSTRQRPLESADVRTVPPPNTVSPAEHRRGVVAASDRIAAIFAARHATYCFAPQIDMSTGRLAGIEAILCVAKPEGYRSADGLVAELESSGLGMALAEHRLRAACGEQSAWLRDVGHNFPIGVPVCHRTLAQADFMPLVQRILAEHDLAPAFLELEVVGHGFAAAGIAGTASLANAHDVREAGIALAIDGFNAANVSLRLLSILPISKLRVDPWLLLREDKDGANGLLFDAILGAAHGLGITVCVTSVGTPGILEAVLRHGRPLAQGNALGHPRDARAMRDFMRARASEDMCPAVPRMAHP